MRYLKSFAGIIATAVFLACTVQAVALAPTGSSSYKISYSSTPGGSSQLGSASYQARASSIGQAVTKMTAAAFAPDVYVAGTGNDVTGDGTVGNPFRTIQHGITMVDPNGTIHVAAGNYSAENLTIDKTVTITGTGTSVPTVASITLNSGAVVTGSAGVTASAVNVNAGAKIQDGILVCSAGGQVAVGTGTYLGEVNVDKTLNLHGAGYANTTIQGPKSTGTGNTVLLGANNIIFEGFTVTRDGNNTTDWATNKQSQGISFGQLKSGIIVQDCKLTGNRNALYMNNAQNNTVRRNIIDDNRTGIQLANNVSGNVFTENEITNNWTMGILFNFDSATLKTSGITIRGNKIAGNWYGDVVCRMASSTAVFDLAGNWFGNNTAPTVSTANSTEPGYVAQIPVEFGGVATPPGGQPNILGVNSAKVCYNAWLNSATDTDGAAIGFQGDFSLLHVSAASPVATGASGLIQQGIDLASASGTVTVAAGSYSSENLVIAKHLILTGTGTSNPTVSSITLNGGAVVTGSTGVTANTVNVNAGAIIQDGILVCNAGGQVSVGAGTYAENVNVNKAISLLGPNAGIDGNSGSRGAEAVVWPGPGANDTDTFMVFRVASSNVTIDGFKVDGYNSDLNIWAYELVDNSQDWSVSNDVDHVMVRNNVLTNFWTGVFYYIDSSVSRSWFIVAHNKFDGVDGGWEAVNTEGAHLDVSDNTILNVNQGIGLHSVHTACDPTFVPRITGNTVTIGPNWVWPEAARSAGIWVSGWASLAPPMNIANNTVSYPNALPAGKYVRALYCVSALNNRVITFRDNVVNGYGNCTTGFYGAACAPGASTVTIQGGSLNNIKTTGIGAGIVSSEGWNWNTGPSEITVDNVAVTMASGGMGLRSTVSPSYASSLARITVKGGSSVSGAGATGAVLEGDLSELVFTGASPASFSGVNKYIVLQTNGSTLATANVDATAVSFDGQLGSAMSLADLFNVENKITHKLDNAALGFVRVKAANVYATIAKQGVLAGVISRGITAASVNDTVNVEAGTYVEDIALDKEGVTVVGQVGGGVVLQPVGAQYDPFLGATTHVVITADNATLQDVELAGDETICDEAITVDNASTVTVQRCDIHNYNSDAMYCMSDSAASGLEILSNTIHQIREDNNPVAWITTGVYLENVSGVVSGNTFTSNSVEYVIGNIVDNGTPGIDSVPQITSNTIENNTQSLRGGVLRDNRAIMAFDPAFIYANTIRNMNIGIQVQLEAGTSSARDGDVTVQANQVLDLVPGSELNHSTGLYLNSIVGQPSRVALVADNVVSGINGDKLKGTALFTWATTTGTITWRDNRVSGYGEGVGLRGNGAPTVFLRNKIILATGDAGSTGVTFREGSMAAFQENTITGFDTGVQINSDSNDADFGGGDLGSLGRNHLAPLGTVAVRNNGVTTAQARSNWWGDVTGPFNASNNPGGKGEPVSNLVQFDPWYGKGSVLNDTDGDGIIDADEDVNLNYTKDPGETRRGFTTDTLANITASRDTDNDGFEDGTEVRYGSDPLNPSSFPIGPDAVWMAKSNTLDTDHDGYKDFYEYEMGTNRLLNTSKPGLGDATGNGRINSSDVSTLATYVLSGGTTAGVTNNMDVTRNGKINASDVSALSTFLLTPGASLP